MIEIKNLAGETRIVLCQFEREHLVCIPTGSDGKFRVSSCSVIKEVDLVDLGLVESTDSEEASE